MATDTYDEGYEDGHAHGKAKGQNGEYGGCDAQLLRAMDVDYRTGYMDGYAVGNREAEEARKAEAL